VDDPPHSLPPRSATTGARQGGARGFRGIIAWLARDRVARGTRVPDTRMDQRLIINADDFGLSPGINRGIIDAHRRGVVTSASLMATGDAFDDAIALSLAHPGLSVGVHLTLVEGAPVSPPADVPSLVGRDGRFPRSLGAFLRSWLSGRVRPEDMAREFDAQVEKVLGRGVAVDKLDSHMHLHVLPGVLPSVLATARRHGIKAIRRPVEQLRYHRELPGLLTLATRAALSTIAVIQSRGIAKSRLRSPDHFAGLAESGALTTRGLKRFLRDLGSGVTEIMTHPGYHDPVLDRWPESRRYRREGELHALLSPEVQQALRDLRIELTTFRELSRHG
jgi:hopanoid biosynthesis associated protein HpnK